MSTPHIAPPRSAKLSLLNLLPILVYLQLFLSKSHPHNLRLTKRTLNPCLLKIYFHSMNCSWRFASPSATTARPAAYNSFWSITFIQIFLLISSTTAINNNRVKALPCVTPTFTLDSPYTSGPHSSPLFVSPPPIGPPPGTPIHISVPIVISLEIVA